MSDSNSEDDDDDDDDDDDNDDFEDDYTSSAVNQATEARNPLPKQTDENTALRSNHPMTLNPILSSVPTDSRDLAPSDPQSAVQARHGAITTVTVADVTSESYQDTAGTKDTAATAEAADAAVSEAAQAAEAESKTEIEWLKSQLAQEKVDAAAKLKQLEIEKVTLEAELEVASRRELEVESLRRELSASQKLNSEVERQLQQDEKLRRKLHHTIQELKGNIRVICRIRPHGSNTADPKDPGRPSAVTCPAGSIDRAIVRDGGKINAFTFDRVFGESASQADIFDEVEPVVQSALDGYNVCIFAYGQTGAGKTYTMEGDGLRADGAADTELQGLIPRTIRATFRSISGLAFKGWTYTVKTSFIEIYNDSIYDLLSDDTEQKHEIHYEPHTHQIIVTNLCATEVTSEEEVSASWREHALAAREGRGDCNAKYHSNIF